MKGVSEVIAIILILMITIAITGLAYTFMSSTMSSTTSAASSAVTTTTSSILTSFTIESIDAAKVYIRNTGQNALSSLSVYVNDEPTIYNIAPSQISSGQVGTVTIYSFIPDGATVKITSPNGFSTSKVATPCSNAVGCWKFDEASGSVAYDSSPNANTGTLNGMNNTGNNMNGTLLSGWASGRYGSALGFDRGNDFVSLQNPSVLEGYDSGTFDVWFKATSGGLIYSLTAGAVYTDYVMIYVGDATGAYADESINCDIKSANSLVLGMYVRNGHNAYLDNMWHHAVIVTGNGNNSIYIDGISQAITYRYGTSTTNAFSNLGTFDNARIGNWRIQGADASGFNGTIDEVRIYNRAIY